MQKVPSVRVFHRRKVETRTFTLNRLIYSLCAVAIPHEKIWHERKYMIEILSSAQCRLRQRQASSRATTAAVKSCCRCRGCCCCCHHRCRHCCSAAAAPAAAPPPEPPPSASASGESTFHLSKRSGRRRGTRRTTRGASDAPKREEIACAQR